jgi:hypothetical protein
MGIALALVFVGVGLDLNVAADDVGIILQVVGSLQDVFFLDVLYALDFHVHVLGCRCHLLRTLVLHHVAAGPARPRLIDGLLGAAFGTEGGGFCQIIEAGAARNADPLSAEFRLRHENIGPFMIFGRKRERAPMPPRRGACQMAYRCPT